MINSSKLTDTQMEDVNNFTQNCTDSTNLSKNGNSLKLELELALYDAAGIAEFHKKLSYIHTKIDKIHSNIRITKNK